MSLPFSFLKSEASHAKPFYFSRVTVGFQSIGREQNRLEGSLFVLALRFSVKYNTDMKRNGALDDPRVSNGRLEDDEEPTEEEYATQSFSDSENDCTGRPSKKLDKEPFEEQDEASEEEPSEEPFEEQSEASEGESSEEPFEENEESEGVPLEEPFDEYTSQPSPNPNNNDTEHESDPTSNSSNKKKKSLDATEGDSVSFQASKGKSEQPFVPESYARSPFKDIQKITKTSAVEKQEEGGSFGKQRRSRWDLKPESDLEGGEADRTVKRRKTRWSSDDSQLKMLGPLQLPDFVKCPVDVHIDPEIHNFEKRLVEINKELYKAEVHDGQLGKTRFQKLIKERRKILSRLIKNNPRFKTPEYKPSKFQKKLYVPVKEYPGYNFIGLILGPRGRTHKKMEKESGAQIHLRGKGSVLDSKSKKPHPPDNEDLHVLVEAENQQSLDEAVTMIQRLLVPLAEGMNEHKRAQLKELAELNDKLRNDENNCSTCGEQGHKHYACPNKNSDFSNYISCDTCGGCSHSTLNCPLTVLTPSRNLANHPNMGGPGWFAYSTPPISSSVPCGSGNSSYPGIGSTPTTGRKSNTNVDDTNLYVGYLPPAVDDNCLKELFSSFGRLIEAKVIKDRSTAISKGYGFVKYDNPIDAANAVAQMNGYRIEGKILAVSVAGVQPTTPSTVGLLLKYPGPVAVFKESPSQQAWPGPPGSLLPELESAVTQRVGLNLPRLSIFLGHSDSREEHQIPSSHGSKDRIQISSDSSLQQFPGHPDYRSSKHELYFRMSPT